MKEHIMFDLFSENEVIFEWKQNIDWFTIFTSWKGSWIQEVIVGLNIISVLNNETKMDIIPLSIRPRGLNNEWNLRNTGRSYRFNKKHFSFGKLFHL